MLGFGTIAWGREMRRVVACGERHAPALTYAVTPLILMLGVLMLVGTLLIEHATLTELL